MADENGYNAAGTSKIRIALTSDPNKISLVGKIGDAVQLISSIAPPAEYTAVLSHTGTSEEWDKHLFKRVPQSCWINETDSLAASCQRYRDVASRDEAFRLTLTGNRSVEHCTTSRNGQRAEKATDYPLYYWHFRQFLSKLCPSREVNGAGIPQLLHILAQHMEGHLLFETAYMFTCQGRRFFTTLGRYMGVGPPGMRLGDSICVFLGGNVP